MNQKLTVLVLTPVPAMVNVASVSPITENPERSPDVSFRRLEKRLTTARSSISTGITKRVKIVMPFVVPTAVAVSDFVASVCDY